MKDQLTAITTSNTFTNGIWDQIRNSNIAQTYKPLTIDDIKSLSNDLFGSYPGFNPNSGTNIKTINLKPRVYGTGGVWNTQPFNGINNNYIYGVDSFNQLHLTEEQYREYKKIVMQFEDMIEECKLQWESWKKK